MSDMRFSVAAAQSASVPGDLPANVHEHLRFARAAHDAGARLLLFPELSLTGYELTLAPRCALGPTHPVLSPLAAFAISSGLTIAAGAPVPDGRGDLHIAQIVFHPSGRIHLHPNVFVHESERHLFSPGPPQPPFPLGPAAIALAICFDAANPPHAAAAASAKVTRATATAWLRSAERTMLDPGSST